MKKNENTGIFKECYLSKFSNITCIYTNLNGLCEIFLQDNLFLPIQIILLSFMFPIIYFILLWLTNSNSNSKSQQPV